MCVGDGVEVLAISTSSTQRSPCSMNPSQSAKGVMGRASRPEAVRAGQEFLLVNLLQHHDIARCATLSSNVGMPNGLCEPSALGM